MNFIDIAGVTEIENGQMKMVKAGHNEVVVARVNDKYYAFSRRCSHLGGDLARGSLTGTVITCPLHHSQFDITDGHVIRWTNWTGKLSVMKKIRSPRPLKTYKVNVADGRIMVEDERIP